MRPFVAPTVPLDDYLAKCGTSPVVLMQLEPFPLITLGLIWGSLVSLAAGNRTPAMDRK